MESKKPLQLDTKLLDQALVVAQGAASAAGKILRQRYRRIRVIEDKHKDIQDFVTEADRESEKEILKLIRQAFPHHAIWAEESGKQGSSRSEYQWFIDPLCGTANFVNHLDLFVVSIGLTFRSRPVLGVIYHPLKKLLYSAIVNQGATINRQPVHVSLIRRLSRSVVAVTFGKTKADRRCWVKPIGKLVMRAYKIREFGSTPFSCSLLADGRIDAFIGRPEPWDVVSGIVLVQEAGGKVTDWEGQPWTLGSQSLVATNGKNHAQILRLLK
jgi:myo-inositol-1(or 4)-monophosphatase